MKLALPLPALIAMAVAGSMRPTIAQLQSQIELYEEALTQTRPRRFRPRVSQMASGSRS